MWNKDCWPSWGHIYAQIIYIHTCAHAHTHVFSLARLSLEQMSCLASYVASQTVLKTNVEHQRRKDTSCVCFGKGLGYLPYYHTSPHTHTSAISYRILIFILYIEYLHGYTHAYYFESEPISSCPWPETDHCELDESSSSIIIWNNFNSYFIGMWHVWDVTNHYICQCACTNSNISIIYITWQKVHEIVPLSFTQDMKEKWKDSLHLM